MKKLAAILLLALFLFNTVGYYLLVNWMDHKQDIAFTRQIDNRQYDESSLIEISVPLALPYYNNSSYERIDGEVTVKGITYKYVERKVENGMLLVRCLPDYGKQQLQEKAVNYFAGVNGLKQDAPQKNSDSRQIIKNIVTDFEELQLVAVSSIFNSLTSDYAIFNSKIKSSLYRDTPEQPPEMA